MTEQEVIDYMMLDREPCYQRHDAIKPDSCGHYNCQYHGLCMYVELVNVLGSHANIENFIQTHPHNRTREDFCYGCGHRCRSVKYKGQHTPTSLCMGKLQHHAQCICRGFAVDTERWYNCHDENAYQSEHERLQPVWESAQGVPHEDGLQGRELRDMWSGSNGEASECGVHRSEVSQPVSAG